ncbi:hypothetical protein GLOTRDRAFT_132227 [Gloeophyllum trabeum ATCC 11539]|uniref:Uncharacterized protein n=1 Tax=Gloeophyllum trabeum (strain ATCC 11539 / FP-39264 / Madison 617) TaxID=670483 RepID=S7PX84_GLOTA|nr:uncharacterized protein GLOTRDRAFT_132227 [Gloeophyllum trabeum ATCC 11539]EPQ52108.1 hypothetical protein GLOTRDRAFT_132227 [Gloeophyllum trabeum ATCC 11539]
MRTPLGLGLADQTNLAIFTPWFVKYRIPVTVLPVVPPRRRQIKRRQGESRTDFKYRFRASIRKIITQSLLNARWRDWQYRNSILDSQVAAVPHVRRICLGEHLEDYDGSGRAIPSKGKRRRDGYDAKAYRYGIDDGRPDLVKRCRVSRSEHRMSLMDIDGLFLLDHAARDEHEGKQIVAKVFQFSFPVELDATVPMHAFAPPKQTVDNPCLDVSSSKSLNVILVVPEEDSRMGIATADSSEDAATVPSTAAEASPSSVDTAVDASPEVPPVVEPGIPMSLCQSKPLKSILKNDRVTNRMTPYARKPKVTTNAAAVHGSRIMKRGGKARMSALTLIWKSLPEELRNLASVGDLRTVRDRMLGINTCDVYDGTTTVDPRVRTKNGNYNSKATHERRAGLRSFRGQGSALKAFHDNMISYLVASGISAVCLMHGRVPMSAYGDHHESVATEAVPAPVVYPLSSGVEDSQHVAESFRDDSQQHQVTPINDSVPDVLQDGSAADAGNDDANDVLPASDSGDSVPTTPKARKRTLQRTLSEQIFGTGSDSDSDSDFEDNNNADPPAGGCARAEEREQHGLQFDRGLAAGIAPSLVPVEAGNLIHAVLPVGYHFGPHGDASNTTPNAPRSGRAIGNEAPDVTSGD